MKKLILSLALCFTFALSMMGADKVAYTLTFATGSGTGELLTDAVDVSDVISNSNAADYVSGFESLKNVKYISSKGIYLGKSASDGSITLNLATKGRVKASKIDLSVSGSAAAATVTVNSTTEDNSQSIKRGESKTFEYSLDGSEISQIVIKTIKNIVYLKTITVYVSDGASGSELENAGLSFEGATGTLIARLGEDFEEPRLTKATDADVTYTSSDPSVAAVDAVTGEITPVSAYWKTVTITATAPATDKFKAGTASYTLKVVNASKSIADFNKLGAGESRYIDFETTVAYVDNYNMYLTDGTDFISVSGSRLSDTYKVGDRIPAGWDASMKIYYGLPQLSDAYNIPKVVTAGEFTPAEVESVDLSNMNAIVVLKNVMFEKPTSEVDKNYYFKGVVGETSYDFSNFFSIPDVGAGAYNVKLAVSVVDENAKGSDDKDVIGTDASKIVLYPIEYEEIPVEVPELMIGEDVIAGDRAETTDGVLKFNVPEGILVYFIVTSTNTTDPVDLPEVPANAPAKVLEIDENMEHEDMPDVTFEYYDKNKEYRLGYGNNDISYFAYDPVSARKSAVKTVSVNNTTGIESIDSDAADAEYFDMLGRRVSNPANGLYIKRTNGASTKVLVK